MNNKTSSFNQLASNNINEFKGVYGAYTITNSDKLEVKSYRLALFLSGITFLIGLAQWVFIGPEWASIWLIPMVTGLGFALKWIHIYIRPLHKLLQIFWALGCLGTIILFANFGAKELLTELTNSPIKALAIGPFFAALTGIGFKEFFCFQRIEAIGLTLLIPIALLSHLSGIFNGEIVMALLLISATLFLIMGLRKFGMEHERAMRVL